MTRSRRPTGGSSVLTMSEVCRHSSCPSTGDVGVSHMVPLVRPRQVVPDCADMAASTGARESVLDCTRGVAAAGRYGPHRGAVVDSSSVHTRALKVFVPCTTQLC